MIKSITIKSVASFDEVGVCIDELKPINIIYGANGTGKSSVSRVIADCCQYPSCNIEWLSGQAMAVLAYNREFREKNFVEQMPGIFTLGEATNETIKSLDEKRKDLDFIAKQGRILKQNKEQKELERKILVDEFRNAAWNDVLKEYEADFPKTVTHSNSKESFVSGLLEAFSESDSDVIRIDELREKSTYILGEHPELVSPVDEIIVKLNEIESNPIWMKPIIGKDDVDISGLIRTLGNADWVNQGVRYVKEDSDICPFCQQHTISTNFREQLTRFFDEDYKKSVDGLATLLAVYIQRTTAVLSSWETILLREKDNPKSFLDIPKITTIKTQLHSVVESNKNQMQAKQKEPSRRIAIESTDMLIGELNDQIKIANSNIDIHNKIVENFANECKTLISQIWQFYVQTYKVQIKKYKDELGGIDKAIASLENKIDDARKRYRILDAEIKRLENSVTSVKPTINEINRLLRGFGFTNFIIQEVPTIPNHYQIVRPNGESAKETLSEGEATFITFLYYMQLVKGSFTKEGITENRILVIDDPVSSLDSNVLFIVSTLIREIFDKIHSGESSIKQVLLLTHNVYFHKELTYYSRCCKWRDCVYYWILRKNNNVSSIEAFKEKNPINSSYDLLWKELKSPHVTSCVVAQNIMRRIIENYFSVFGGYTEEAILDSFKTIEDKQACRALLSWVNGGSHTLQEDLYVETSTDQLARYREVFHQIFINMHQESHYDMMMRAPTEE